MTAHDPTRRTALKLLAAGTVVTAGTGVTSATDHGKGTDQPDDYPPHALPDDLYVATLSPQEDVQTDARGFAAFQFRDGEVTFALAVSNIEDTFMTHIHEAEVLGPIVVWLHDFDTQDEELIEGRFSGLLDAGTITDETIAAGRAEEAQTQTVDQLIQQIDAGEAFVNVHTEANPDGELAGQIEPVSWDAVTAGMQ